MTQEKLDEMIREVIIEQEKPKSTGNSYFRKQGEKRLLERWLNPTVLQNAAINFYKKFFRLRAPEQYYYGSDCYYMYIWGNDDFVGCRCCRALDGVRYSSLTGRFKLIKYCEPRKDVRNKRMIKRIKRRQLRKTKVEIANGSAYKKIRMKHPIFT